MSMELILGRTAIALIVLGTIGGMIPLWKSTRLSPDSIKRRVYWACAGPATVLCFLALLPDWRTGMFVGGGVGLTLAAIALYWTGLVKIRGRVYSALPDNRRPDRPPALRRDA